MGTRGRPARARPRTAERGARDEVAARLECTLALRVETVDILDRLRVVYKLPHAVAGGDAERVAAHVQLGRAGDFRFAVKV